jgi:hypothetical protein
MQLTAPCSWQIIDGPTFRRENLEFAAQPDRRLSNTDPAWLAVYLMVRPRVDASLTRPGVVDHNQVQPECRDAISFLPFVRSRAAAHGLLQDQPHGSRGGRLPRSTPDQAHPGEHTFHGESTDGRYPWHTSSSYSYVHTRRLELTIALRRDTRAGQHCSPPS